MRKLQTALALLLMSLPVFLIAQDSRLSIEPKFPQQGSTINFSFDAAGSAVDGAGDVSAIVFVYDKKGMYAEEKTLTRSGDKYSGSVNLPADATAVAFNFVSGDKKDNNNRKGYITQVYDNKQQPVMGSNKTMYRLIGSFGGYEVGIDRNVDAGFPYIEKEYKAYPQNIKENFQDYYGSMLDSKQPNANEVLLAELDKIAVLGDLSENDYSMLSRYYARLKQPQKSEALAAKKKEKFPEGDWKKNEVWQAVMAEKDGAKRESMARDYINKYKPENAWYLKWQLAESFAKEKNWDKFNALVKDIDIKNLASQYNNTAWRWAGKDENLDMAKQISKQATEYAKKQIGNPTGEKPRNRTEKQWKADREGTYAMYADTYAFILYKLKDYKTGLEYARDAVNIGKRKDAENNDRYALLLEQVAKPAQVKTEIEAMVKEGNAGKDAREVLQRNYVKINKSDKGYDAYIDALDAVNLAKLKEELKKKMMAKNAPDFRLVNLEGTEVSFASLKGKVVIVDFWATWCGPCIASFPSMQKMVQKYKNDPNVAFIFIDTWENVPNRKKLVEDFVSKNKYTFNVLYDKLIEEGSSDFAVVKDYEVEGIPTKFVVDGTGQIRFKSIGWSGNEFAFMQELSLMIEMAGSGGSGENGKKGF
jgi:thiol-disulfide isomerase/thioredoxin